MSAITPEELRESIREVLETESGLATLRAAASDAGYRFDALWQQLSQLGWLGLATEESLGGLGLGFQELGILYEELGRYLTPLPLMTTLLAAESVRRAGSEDQKRHWLPLLASGEIRATISLAGADELPKLDARGTAQGRIQDVLFADQADEIMLPVQDSAGAQYLAIIPRTAPGLRIDMHPAIDLTRTLGEIHLAEVSVSADRLLPLPQERRLQLFDHAAVALACDAVGGAAHILERTIAYLQTRTQFDRPIGSFQALKHRAATWKIRLEAVTALCRHACALIDSADESASAIASCAKFTACDAYVAIAGDALQLHGGIGFTWDHECHLFLKRAKLSSVLFGGPIEHRERVAALTFADALSQSGEVPPPIRRLP